MPEEIEEMEHEGIAINYLVAPLEVIGEKGRVKGLRLTKMQLGEFDKSGRRRPAPVAGSEFDVDADVIIAAIGQSVETAPLGTEIKLTRWGTVAADAETMATSVPGIFAGGDCVSGPDTVITAIADGKKAAAAIDRYLGGDGMVTEPLTIERRVSGTLIEQVTPRQKCGLQGFNEAQACAEASRCLRCDVAE